MSEESQPTQPKRVVFDANLFIQSLLSGRGPSFACLELISQGRVILCVTESILAEVEEVLRRLSQKAKYQKHLSADTIEAFMVLIRARAEIQPEPPHVFDLERDKDDEVYIDLAVAVGAVYLTSRDNDLLDLMDPSTATGTEFHERFPDLTILDPVDFLRRMREGS